MNFLPIVRLDTFADIEPTHDELVYRKRKSEQRIRGGQKHQTDEARCRQRRISIPQELSEVAAMAE